MFPILGWGYFGLGHFLHIFVTHVTHFFYLRHFTFILPHHVLIVTNTFSQNLICMLDEIIKKMILVLHSNQKLPQKFRNSNLEGKQYLHEGIL